jgi:hypothetical protein
MKTPTKEVMNTFVKNLRQLAPNRSLSYGESLQVARIQAARLRTWAGATEQPDINLAWLINSAPIPYILHQVTSWARKADSPLTPLTARCRCSSMNASQVYGNGFRCSTS